MQENYTTAQGTSIKTKDIATTGLLIALVFIATRFINIPSPISANGGLIHFGNVMLFTAAIVFGKKKGTVAGAFGMALFDVLSGWMAWAPFTFIIRGIMGFIVGTISNFNGKNGKSIVLNLIAIIVSGIWMIAGYYATEGILYGNWIAPVKSIPGNIAQLVIGLLALLIVPALKRLKIA